MADKTNRIRGAKPEQITRRQFAGRAAIGIALPVVAPAGLLAPAAGAEPVPALPQASEAESKLKPEARAEAEEKISALLRKYGTRLSDEQKADIRRLMFETQQSLETLRAYPLENSDEPATVLRPKPRVAKSASTGGRRKSPVAAAKKPA